MCVKVTASQR